MFLPQPLPISLPAAVHAAAVSIITEELIP
jgi:hypothetical protein